MSQPNLLMIHGLLGSIDYFEPRKHFAGLSVYTPDLLGYGTQDNVKEASAINLYIQADYIAQTIRERIGAQTWLLGHSIGGAIAMLVAQRLPQLISGVISVEGNFTLNDAFWCAKISATELDEWIQQYLVMKADPEGLLTRGAIAFTEQRLAWARAILSNQPAATVHRMARSVIQETGTPAYLDLVRQVARHTPIYLLAGERSASDWDVPNFVRKAACDFVVIRGTGHMMMLEDPAGFCRIVEAFIKGAPG